MKVIKTACVALLAGALLLGETACNSMTNTGKGALIGGGGGAGITISPVAFLVVNNGSVSVKYINAAEGSVERVIGMVPDIVDKATEVVDKIRNKDNSVDAAINDYMASDEPAV